jgi:hypothetical protein
MSKEHLSLAEASEEQIADALEGNMPEEPAQEAEPTPDETKPPKIFGPAEDVEKIARAIISQSYPKVQGTRFVYLYVSESFKQDGEDCLMKAVKVQGVNAYMAQFLSENVEAPADPFFLILVNKPMWTAMDIDQKLAILDITLWQCDIRETGALYIRKPEIKTSVEVIHRRGLYTNRLKDMGQVAKKHILQPELMEAS